MNFKEHSSNGSDSGHLDNRVREFLNKVDKTLVKVHQETNLKCGVICTEDNFSRLQQVTDQPEIYPVFDGIDYNNVAPHQISAPAWRIVSEMQKQRSTAAIDDITSNIAWEVISKKEEGGFHHAERNKGNWEDGLKVKVLI